MNKTNLILGVLTAVYAAYIGIALLWSRSRERFIARKRRYELIPGMKRPMRQSRQNRVVIAYRKVGPPH